MLLDAGARILRRAVRGIGVGLLGIGVLGLLFVAFQLWGTGYFQAKKQASLRHQFEATLNRDIKKSTAGNNSTQPKGVLHIAAAIDAPPLADPVGTISIAKIGLDQVIVEGVNEAELSIGPGHYPGTPLPGEMGDVAIAGHRTTWGHPFYDLNELVPGDQVVIDTVQGKFTYSVTGTQVVQPSDVEVLAPTKTPTLTLTTCNPRFSASQRLVVKARLISSILSAPKSSAKPRAAANDQSGLSADQSSNLAASEGDWVIALWRGIACLVVLLFVSLLARRMRRTAVRAMIYGGGAIGFLVLLFFFFASLSVLLPASY